MVLLEAFNINGTSRTGGERMRVVDAHRGSCIPLLINGISVVDETGARQQAMPEGGLFQGATISNCQEAMASSSEAFKEWSRTSPFHRRQLLLNLAELVRQQGDIVKQIMQEEIYCTEEWSHINLVDSIGMIEETAARLTSKSLSGEIAHSSTSDSCALVFSRPLGVVLGIAPWNSPLILGFRAVLAPVAVGNTAILKGSELSPRTHYFIAKVFLDSGFPPGIVNLIFHRSEDAPEIIEHLIKGPSIRKVDFTGSTAVGRIIAQKAGEALKPVLLELGGKNCSIICEDADVAKAAKLVVKAATLNAGQICMSTELVLVVDKVADKLKAELQKATSQVCNTSYKLISPQSALRVRKLAVDAASKGGKITSAPMSEEIEREGNSVPFRIIENVRPAMDFFLQESFGPMLGVMEVSTEEEAIEFINSSEYALSSAIWTRDHYRALGLARKLDVSAVHINGSTVHDEATLPHGGAKSSGFGRFGGEWGLLEFVQTQTVILNP